MSKLKGRRCAECGGMIRLVAKPGRRGRYKTMMLPIPASLKIPTCASCGSEWIDRATGAAIDVLLERAFRGELRARAKDAIERIAKQVTKQRLERLLGLSQGYLSHLTAGDRDPSPELVSQLALIARAPKQRVRELEDFWGWKSKDAA